MSEVLKWLQTGTVGTELLFCEGNTLDLGQEHMERDLYVFIQQRERTQIYALERQIAFVESGLVQDVQLEVVQKAL